MTNEPTASDLVVVRMFRKECAEPTRKPAKGVLAELDHELILARVRRSDLETFIRSGGFHKLTPLPANVIKDAALRRRDYTTPKYCYTFTPSDFGRSTVGETGAMAGRTWIEKYYVPKIIAVGEFAIVVDTY